jgi:UDP-GlcNAc:undecaprenyl-phosphate/decaprenyl-phosphate GlcNAc-1-phosphate transferase
MEPAVVLPLAVLAGFVTAFAGGWLLIAAQVWDQPDLVHKRHRTPTPSSGGLAIMLGCGCGLLVVALGLPETLRGELALPALILALGAGLLGFADDVLVLGAGRKLAAMSLAVGLAVTIGGLSVPMPEALRGPQTSLIVIALAGAGLACGSWLWFMVVINTVNFMDGANGLSVGTVAVALAGVAGLAFEASAMTTLMLALSGLAGSLGFLVWNAPRGALFAGDSGSLFCGAWFAGIGMTGVNEGLDALLVALCLLPLLADVILTVIHRARHSGPGVLLQPHRQHVYQLMITRGLRHGPVARRWWLSGVICCALAIAAAWFLPPPGATGTVSAASAGVLVAASVVAILLLTRLRRTHSE